MAEVKYKVGSDQTSLSKRNHRYPQIVKRTLTSNGRALSMNKECITRAIHHFVHVVIELVIIRVRRWVDKSSGKHISVDIGNGCNESVIYGLRCCRNIAHLYGIWLSKLFKVLYKGKHLPSGREAAQYRHIHAVLWDNAVFDYQSLNGFAAQQ